MIIRPNCLKPIAPAQRDQGREAQVGGMAYLTTVLNAAPGLANIRAYAETVHGLYKVRQTILVCQRGEAQGYGGIGAAGGATKYIETVASESALAEVKGSILLDRIAEAEHTEVTDKEVEDQVQLIAYQTREAFDTVRARLTEDGSLARIREQLRREKTRAALYDRIGS